MAALLRWPLLLELELAAHQALSAFEQEVASLELSLVEMKVLINMVFERGMTARALAGASGLKPSTLTGVIDRLERAGLLERSRDGTDRRMVTLHLTPEGEESAVDVTRAMYRYGKRLTASVTLEDVAALRHVLSAIASSGATKASRP